MVRQAAISDICPTCHLERASSGFGSAGCPDCGATLPYKIRLTAAGQRHDEPAYHFTLKSGPYTWKIGGDREYGLISRIRGEWHAFGNSKTWNQPIHGVGSTPRAAAEDFLARVEGRGAPRSRPTPCRPAPSGVVRQAAIGTSPQAARRAIG